jgi:proteic killer suppression protein
MTNYRRHGRRAARGPIDTRIFSSSESLAQREQGEEAERVAAETTELHSLTGELRGFHSITVNGNWRVIFRFVGQDVELVDYLDYH